MFSVSIVVATFGDLSWEQLAYDRAMPSAKAQNPDSLVAVHLHEGTLAEARNLGAQDASGDWLCFLDADDELAPGYLDAMRATMHTWNLWRCDDVRRNPLLLVPAVEYLGNAKWAHQNPPRSTGPRVLNDGRPLHDINHAVIGTLVPRRLFLELDGFRDLPALEDWELWLRCTRAGARLVDVKDAVYRVHLRENSRNTDQRLYQQIRAEHFDALGAPG